jgi:hypothetical protein
MCVCVFLFLPWRFVLHAFPFVFDDATTPWPASLNSFLCVFATPFHHSNQSVPALDAVAKSPIVDRVHCAWLVARSFSAMSVTNHPHCQNAHEETVVAVADSAAAAEGHYSAKPMVLTTMFEEEFLLLVSRCCPPLMDSTDRVLRLLLPL